MEIEHKKSGTRRFALANKKNWKKPQNLNLWKNPQFAVSNRPNWLIDLEKFSRKKRNDEKKTTMMMMGTKNDINTNIYYPKKMFIIFIWFFWAKYFRIFITEDFHFSFFSKKKSKWKSYQTRSVFGFVLLCLFVLKKTIENHREENEKKKIYSQSSYGYDWWIEMKWMNVTNKKLFPHNMFIIIILIYLSFF